MATSFLSPCKSMPAGAPGGALVFAYCFGCGVPSGGKEVGLFRQSKACKDVVEQVYFLGAEAAVQFQPSSTWLAEQAAAWPWKSHLLINRPAERSAERAGQRGRAGGVSARWSRTCLTSLLRWAAALGRGTLGKWSTILRT